MKTARAPQAIALSRVPFTGIGNFVSLASHSMSLQVNAASKALTFQKSLSK
jgi:hypothetical protein